MRSPLPARGHSPRPPAQARAAAATASRASAALARAPGPSASRSSWPLVSRTHTAERISSRGPSHRRRSPPMSSVRPASSGVRQASRGIWAWVGKRASRSCAGVMSRPLRWTRRVRASRRRGSRAATRACSICGAGQPRATSVARSRSTSWAAPSRGSPAVSSRKRSAESWVSRKLSSGWCWKTHARRHASTARPSGVVKLQARRPRRPRIEKPAVAAPARVALDLARVARAVAQQRQDACAQPRDDELARHRLDKHVGQQHVEAAGRSSGTPRRSARSPRTSSS